MLKTFESAQTIEYIDHEMKTSLVISCREEKKQAKSLIWKNQYLAYSDMFGI